MVHEEVDHLSSLDHVLEGLFEVRLIRQAEWMGAVDGQVDVLRVPIKTRRPSERRLQGFHVRLHGWNRPVVTPVCVTLFAFRERNRLDVDFVALRKHGAEVREYIGGPAVVDVAESNT